MVPDQGFCDGSGNVVWSWFRRRSLSLVSDCQNRGVCKYIRLRTASVRSVTPENFASRVVVVVFGVRCVSHGGWCSDVRLYFWFYRRGL